MLSKEFSVELFNILELYDVPKRRLDLKVGIPEMRIRNLEASRRKNVLQTVVKHIVYFSSS